MNQTVVCPACGQTAELTAIRQMPMHNRQRGLRVLCRASGWRVPDVPDHQLAHAWRYYLTQPPAPRATRGHDGGRDGDGGGGGAVLLRLGHMHAQRRR